MSTYALTGASGFVGLHLSRTLREQGHEVRALVRKTSKTSALEALGVSIHRVDLLDAASMHVALSGIDGVVHAAGGGRTGDPDALKRANTGTSIALAQAVMHSAPDARFVFVSSAAAHGPAKMDEVAKADDPDHPTSGYGASKLAAEVWLKEQQDSLRSVILRPPGVYGPGDDRMVGLFKAAAKGWLLNLGDGTLSMIGVTDLVSYCIRALTVAVPSGTRLFVEDGETYSALRLGQAAAEAIGRDARPLKVPVPVLKVAGALGGLWGSVSGKNVFLNPDKVKDVLQPSWCVDGALAREVLQHSPTETFEDAAPVMLEDFRQRGLL